MCERKVYVEGKKLMNYSVGRVKSRGDRLNTSRPTSLDELLTRQVMRFVLQRGSVEDATGWVNGLAHSYLLVGLGCSVRESLLVFV